MLLVTYQILLLGCSNLTDESYANIINVLPMAFSLTNTNIYNTGLIPSRFTAEQNNTLAHKGYMPMVINTINTDNISTDYNIHIIDDNTWINISKGPNYDLDGRILKANIPTRSYKIRTYRLW